MTAHATLRVVAVSALMVAALFATSAAGGPLEDAGVLPISDEDCSSTPDQTLCEEVVGIANENLTTLDGVLDIPWSALNGACSEVGGDDVDNCTALLGALPETVEGILDGVCSMIGGDDVDDCDGLAGSVGPGTVTDLVQDQIGNEVAFDDFTGTAAIHNTFTLTGSVEGVVPQALAGTATVTKPDLSTEDVPFTWVDDDNAIEPPLDNDGAAFSIDYTTTIAGTYVFEFEVDNETFEDLFFEANDTIAIDVVGVVGGSSELNITVLDTGTVFTLDPNGFTRPVGGVSSSQDVITSLQDDNGFGDIDAAGMTVVVKQPAGLPDIDITDPAPEDNTTTFTRNFTNTVAGTYFKDGAYQVNASSGGGFVNEDFAVVNEAPTVIGNGQSGSGLEDVGDLFLGNFTVDDGNWGSIGAETVTEVAAADIRVVDNVGTPVTEFVIRSAPEGSPLAPTDSIDLSALALDGGGQEIDFEVSYVANAVAPGSYTVQAQATDDDTTVSGWQDVFTLDIEAANVGFFLQIDDGGNGIDLGSAAPGESTDSSGDPVNVTFTGTEAAASLFLMVGDFEDAGSNSFASDGTTVEVYANEDLSGVPLTGTVAEGVVTVALAGGLGAAGGSVYVVFETTVPLGTPAGDYSADIDFIGIPA